MRSVTDCLLLDCLPLLSSFRNWYVLVESACEDGEKAIWWEAQIAAVQQEKINIADWPCLMCPGINSGLSQTGMMSPF